MCGITYCNCEDSGVSRDNWEMGSVWYLGKMRRNGWTGTSEILAFAYLQNGIDREDLTSVIVIILGGGIGGWRWGWRWRWEWEWGWK
ncbi:predicted protein [Sclerotinia sclerotiorum 1980 UF-70]|uniref:Uncharacterized protein n=1 Tax=Sclerotinia sclerotiorum (strain ATCC 18683 / 1980 / Ss-1) TaxID=665079 RepID=A7EQJ6_SCLS1|nr:predicted protein [Sclerotinia sclerotiorum 1980 UF-70]EDN91738.1 predicted protein [Sclerotinia sclerotiorum 1980 UF-70]